MKSTLLVAWLGILGVAVCAYGGFYIWRHTAPESDHFVHDSYVTLGRSSQTAKAGGEGDVVPQPLAFPAGGKPVGAFQLTDSHGNAFDSKELHGQVWIGSFFFTTCPGPCYKLNLALADLREDWGDKVRFVSITCNPEIDTCEQLSLYAGRFNADPKQWTFLRGDMEAVQQIGSDVFGLPVAKETHSERAVVFDRRGAIRGMYNLAYPEHQTALKRLVNGLLKEEAP